MTALDDRQVDADDTLIDNLAHGHAPTTLDPVEWALAGIRDWHHATEPQRPEWRPLIPEQHLAHVRYALIVLTLLLTGLSVVIPSRVGTFLCWLASVVAWIGFVIALVVPAFDRDRGAELGQR